MSRRITFLLLAASAALIASPAFADRECFENSCRLPGVAEPPPAVESEPQALAAPSKEAEPALVRHNPSMQSRLAPSSDMPPALPPVIQAKAEHMPVPPKVEFQSRGEQAFMPREAEPIETNESAEAPAEPIRVAPAGRVRNPRVAAYGIAHEGAAGAVSPQPAPLNPQASPDPAYRSCEVQGVRGVVYCGPTSYHPYGAYGYRPNGTYAAYQSPAIYAVAPDAKIITIDGND